MIWYEMFYTCIFLSVKPFNYIAFCKLKNWVFFYHHDIIQELF